MTYPAPGINTTRNAKVWWGEGGELTLLSEPGGWAEQPVLLFGEYVGGECTCSADPPARCQVWWVRNARMAGEPDAWDGNPS